MRGELDRVVEVARRISANGPRMAAIRELIRLRIKRALERDRFLREQAEMEKRRF